MDFDIDAAASEILNQELPRYRRATALFVFLVAIHACRVGSSKNRADRADDHGDRFVIDTRRSTMRASQLLVAMRLMEHIAEEFRRKQPDKPYMSLQEAAQDENYIWLFDQAFQKNGGWLSARYQAQSNRLAKRLKKSRIRAQYIARTLDLSIQFERDPAKPKTLGGITMATTLAPDLKEFRVTRSKSTLLRYWPRFRAVSAWIYLIYVQKYFFRPPFPNKKNFVRDLFRMIDDEESLRQFFGLYQSVCDRLNQRGYKLKTLRLPDGVPQVLLEVLPLSDEARDAIGSYKGV